MARFLQDRGAEIMDAAGALRVTKGESRKVAGGCTCSAPAAWATTRRHRWSTSTTAAHDVPNLFICDGSSLVTSGRGQPTMTIQALAFRAGEHIAGFARRNEI